MMAAIAKYRDDVSGQIVTTGTSTGYVVSSFQGFDTLADMHGKEVWFTPHVTNGATVTINVDSLGAKPLRLAPSVELGAGIMILGTPIGAIYNNTDGAWYLKGNFGNPYNIPLAGGMDFWASTLPNSCFAFPIGQAISRTTYAPLFALMGTAHGIGDGSTTFNLPDKTGCVSAMQEVSATRLTSTYFGGNSTVLGARGGLESNSVILTHNHTLTDPGHTHTTSFQALNLSDSGASGNTGSGGSKYETVTMSSVTTGITIASAGSASAHNICQPTIVCNYIIRII
jgi:microcystin-dependent protein